MTVPTGGTVGALTVAVRRMLEDHWRPAGYTVPHAAGYPFAWLWDSCFHAVIWAALGEGERAVAELRHLFRTQGPTGFVPHIDYEANPQWHAAFWGRPGASTITQPPMYGWAVAALSARGVVPPDDVCVSARRGMSFLLEHRRRHPPTGLVTVVHPWETGCDDSPRWDDWGAADPAAWYEAKGRLLATVERDATGAPLGNPSFAVAPAGFNALVAFNALQLGRLLSDADLVAHGQQLVTALEAVWDGAAGTWVDAGPSEAGSGRVRTADALLPLLVVDPGRGAAAHADLADSGAFAGAFGPRGTHATEPTYDPGRYWRGGVWPPLAYLLWLAAAGRADVALAASLASAVTAGASTSGLAEWWDGDSGVGGGAVPQSWAGVVVLMEGTG